MVKKKILVSLLTAAVTLTMLAGCGSGQDNAASNEDNAGNTSAATEGNAADEGTEQAASTEEEVELTFGFFGDDPEAEMKMGLANAYMEEHPNVKIEFEYCSGADYLTKLQTWFSSEETPDVFALASDQLYPYKDSLLFEDLKHYIENDGCSEYWDMDSVEANWKTDDGRIVAAPFVSKTFAIAYNKALFDQAQIPYPTSDWTEKDMLDAAEKISALGDDIYGIRWGVRVPEFYRNLYGNMFYDVENKKMNVEGNEEFKATITMFVDSIQRGLAPDETDGVISTGGFETGKFGMALSATWDMSTYENAIGDSFQWDVVELPINEQFNTRWLTSFRGNGWCMSSKSKYKDVCWDFIKYMTTTEEAAKAAQSIGIPNFQPYVSSDEYLNDFGEGTPYNKSVFINMISSSTPFYNLGSFAQINDLTKADYQKVLAGDMTVEEMMADVQEQGSLIFDSYQ
jgi:multiple sugar transport system substrate-binding protein